MSTAWECRCGAGGVDLVHTEESVGSLAQETESLLWMLLQTRQKCLGSKIAKHLVQGCGGWGPEGVVTGRDKVDHLANDLSNSSQKSAWTRRILHTASSTNRKEGCHPYSPRAHPRETQAGGCCFHPASIKFVCGIDCSFSFLLFYGMYLDT